jgi:hypothetical protein
MYDVRNTKKIRNQLTQKRPKGMTKIRLKDDVENEVTKMAIFNLRKVAQNKDGCRKETTEASWMVEPKKKKKKKKKRTLERQEEGRLIR